MQGFKLTFGNDKMADICLGVGLIAVGMIISSAHGAVQGMWNDFCAQRFYSDNHQVDKGRMIWETSKAYTGGLYWAALSLREHQEKEEAQAAVTTNNTISQAKQ